MNQEVVDRVVHATLYEGYILYPYRPTSVKNQVRWTFGGVHPRSFGEASGGTERWTAQAQCLLAAEAEARARLDVHVRFLQPLTRTAGELLRPVSSVEALSDADWRAVAELRVGDALHRSWEEAREHDVDCGTATLGELVDAPRETPLTITAGREIEPLTDASGGIAGVLVREWEPLDAVCIVGAEPLELGLHRVTVRVENRTPFELRGDGDRERAMRRSLVSMHAILGVEGGRWISLADPPAEAAEAAQACENDGLWPVLIGEPAESDTVLASPIILEDHPQVAPESAGDLFDSTEIDEILTLRILTLSDEEKEEMRTADARARALLERSENLTAEDFMRMHGTIRGRGHGAGGEEQL